jgi:phosphatidylglycerophosphatase A
MTTLPAEEAARARPRLRALRDPVQLLALGFGAGLSPVAPGTAGSLVGLAAALLAARADTWLTATITVVVVLAGWWICAEGARRLGVHDHPAIVWDEIAGMMIAMLAAPRGWAWAALAFVLFRLFDIVKPWPIREIDHGMRGGAGIILDDVLAGILAALGLLLVRSIT